MVCGVDRRSGGLFDGEVVYGGGEQELATPRALNIKMGGKIKERRARDNGISTARSRW